MNRYLVGAIMSTISFQGLTKSYDKNCFTQHILESIEINKARKPEYAKLTHGKSDAIFNRLIAYEYVTLVPAKFYDMQAYPYIKNGMDLFCHEFMSMHKTPRFDPDNLVIPELDIKKFDINKYRKALKEAFKKNNVELVKQISLEAILELKSQPDYYCFTRHFFESIYRFAYFVPLRNNQADDMGFKSPEKLMMNVAKLHLLAMNECHELDLKAAPIQKLGVPILCSEIPDLLHDLDIPELRGSK